MDLYTGKAYWPKTFQNAISYPALEEDICCDVVIIGGGLSGAQCAYYLGKAGVDVVVVDKRAIGEGSTAANTALLQYAGEKTFVQLKNSFGEENSARHLKQCEYAMNQIEQVFCEASIDSQFIRRDSLYYASCPEDVPKLRQEHELLVKHGFQVSYKEPQEVVNLFPFAKNGALVYHDDAEINPYRLNFALLQLSNARVYQNTEIVGKQLKPEGVTLLTNGQKQIKAKTVIIAAGYETMEFKKEKNTLYTSSYVIVTNPVEDFSSWPSRVLVWESARPYIYMRTTADDRIIIGGLDDNATTAKDRDAHLMNRRDKLVTEFNKRFPGIPVTAEYYLSAFYASTHDGLPVIGQYEEMPNCYCIFAYGDNGTVYSMALAEIVSDMITKGRHPNLDLYLQSRPFMVTV